MLNAIFAQVRGYRTVAPLRKKRLRARGLLAGRRALFAGRRALFAGGWRARNAWSRQALLGDFAERRNSWDFDGCDRGFGWGRRSPQRKVNFLPGARLR